MKERDAAQVALRATELRTLLTALGWRRAMRAHLGIFGEPTVAPDPFGEGLAMLATWPASLAGAVTLLAVPRGATWDLVGDAEVPEVDAESMRTNAGALVEALWPREEGRAA